MVHPDAERCSLNENIITMAFEKMVRSLTGGMDQDMKVTRKMALLVT